MSVLCLFLTVSWVGLQFVIVIIPDHTHLLYGIYTILLCMCASPLSPKKIGRYLLLWWWFIVVSIVCGGFTRVGISRTTAKSHKRKFVPSSHPGPFAVVASSRKSQRKVGTLACFDFLYQNELTM